MRRARERMMLVRESFILARGSVRQCSWVGKKTRVVAGWVVSEEDAQMEVSLVWNDGVSGYLRC